MLKVKEIRKDGKYLTITIKKPFLKGYKEFIRENGLLFEDKDYAVMEPGLTENEDILLKFILRNYDDIRPYISIKDGDEIWKKKLLNTINIWEN